MPLGPTRPTRSPPPSSKPTSWNRGPSSKPRARLEQLSNSMSVVSGQWSVVSGLEPLTTDHWQLALPHDDGDPGPGLQEALDGTLVGSDAGGPLEQRPRFFLAAIKPQLIG